MRHDISLFLGDLSMFCPPCRALNDAQPSQSLTWSGLSSCPSLARDQLPCMGATASREPTHSPADVFWGGRRDQQLRLTHTCLILAVQKRVKVTNDSGMAHLTSKAGFKEWKKCRLITCLKKFGNIILKIFLKSKN